MAHSRSLEDYFEARLCIKWLSHMPPVYLMGILFCLCYKPFRKKAFYCSRSPLHKEYWSIGSIQFESQWYNVHAYKGCPLRPLLCLCVRSLLLGYTATVVQYRENCLRVVTRGHLCISCLARIFIIAE